MWAVKVRNFFSMIKRIRRDKLEWVDDHGTLGQEKEVSYDIVGIPCELPREKTLFKHIRESKIQSIDEMEIVKIEREEG